LAHVIDCGSIDEADKSLMIVTTRIPTHRNDGSKVSDEELEDILQQICDECQGYSLEGPFPGAWVAASGEVYKEESYKLEVVVSADAVTHAQALFMRIGKQLGQRAIFFEVREGGQNIDLE
jgi:hypothetical protein